MLQDLTLSCLALKLIQQTITCNCSLIQVNEDVYFTCNGALEFRERIWD